MAIIYNKAGSEITDLAVEVMAKFRDDLASEGVTVGCLVASDDRGIRSAVKLHGYPCAAVIKITPYKQRVQGVEDAVITFDKGTWERLGEAERISLIDHELHHLSLVLDKKTNRVKTDDLGRPKLKMRMHDFEIGGFDLIVKRHGRHALEAQQVATAYQTLRQIKFDWADDMAGDTRA